MRQLVLIVFSLLAIPTVSSEIPGKGHLLVLEVNRFGNVDYLSSCLKVNYPTEKSFNNKFKKFNRNKKLKCKLKRRGKLSFECKHSANGRIIYIGYYSEKERCSEELARIDDDAYKKRKKLYSQYKDGNL